MSDFSLFELSLNYQQVLSMIQEGESDRYEDTLEMLKDAIEDKVQGIHYVIRQLDGEINTLEKEKERLDKRINTRKNGIKRLKQYLQEEMKKCEMQKIETPMVTVWIQSNPPSVDIKDENKLDDEYLVEQPKKVNRSLLIQELKNGKKIDGVKLIQSKGVRFN